MLNLMNNMERITVDYDKNFKWISDYQEKFGYDISSLSTKACLIPLEAFRYVLYSVRGESQGFDSYGYIKMRSFHLSECLFDLAIL